ncbi:hypothetical protein FKM82_025887, partial [Ascaphus truei]
EGLTALHVAVEGGYSDCVKLLIDTGCDVNARTEKRMDCLHYAASHGHEDIARTLIDAGININAVNYVSTLRLCQAGKACPIFR